VWPLRKEPGFQEPVERECGRDYYAETEHAGQPPSHRDLIGASGPSSMAGTTAANPFAWTKTAD
jgi:hypothetical protein